MDERERIEKQLTDYDDPDRGPDDERYESGEEAIDASGRNPTQRRIDADRAGEPLVVPEWTQDARVEEAADAEDAAT